jgi:hypothetical protein
MRPVQASSNALPRSSLRPPSCKKPVKSLLHPLADCPVRVHFPPHRPGAGPQAVLVALPDFLPDGVFDLGLRLFPILLIGVGADES